MSDRRLRVDEISRAVRLTSIFTCKRVSYERAAETARDPWLVRQMQRLADAPRAIQAHKLLDLWMELPKERDDSLIPAGGIVELENRPATAVTPELHDHVRTCALFATAVPHNADQE